MRGLKTKPGSLTDTRGDVSDIMPTILSLTETKYSVEFNGHEITPPYGRSLAPVIEGGTVPQPEWMFWEHYNDRVARKGDGKSSARQGRTIGNYLISKGTARNNTTWPPSIRKSSLNWRPPGRNGPRRMTSCLAFSARKKRNLAEPSEH